MKKLFLFLFSIALVTAATIAQPPPPPLPKSGNKRAPESELKAQSAHVSSSVNDLVHLRFKKAHEKHMAEARRRNKGIVKDVKAVGKGIPKPPAPPKLN